MSTKHTYIIAEAGVNHNGSLNLARELVDAAAEAGADAVKFQTFRADEIVSPTSPKAVYQQLSVGGTETQFEMLKKLELNDEAHAALAARCHTRGIQFLSTPFDARSIDFLVQRIEVPFIKVPSGEITNGPYLLAAARTRKPIVLSTGMSTLDEVQMALGVIAFGYTSRARRPSIAAFRAAFRSAVGRQSISAKVTLMHCTTAYPAPFSDVNLRAMDTLRLAFDVEVGLSDHTPGTVIAIAAVARGATVVEKHFTLDRGLPGPDHRASIDPSELRAMVRAIRDVELALGSGVKKAARSERQNLSAARRSIVASCDIPKGERLGVENITCKRPGTGTSPMRYWDALGRKATKPYRANEAIRL